MANNEELILETYGDNEITEYANTKVPTFLKFVYVILPIWGIMWWMWYWDGSQGFLDRGYWKELQAASKTKRTEELALPTSSPSKRGFSGSKKD